VDILDCDESDFRSPIITFVDEVVIRVGDVIADREWGLAVVLSESPAGKKFWLAEAFFDAGHC
jgi:hypothetical protein